MICLVGSKALEYWTGLDLKSKDWDFIGESTDTNDGFDYSNLDHLNNREMVERFGVPVKGYDGWDEVMSREGLAIMKRSHLHRDLNWDRHMALYHHHLSGYMVDWDLMKKRQMLTIQEYPQGKPSLNMSNEDFFDDAVDKVYDHDMLHELVAYEKGVPIYTKLKYDDKVDQAWCEKDLWDNLMPEVKNKCVAEETYVIAIERFMVPNDWAYSSHRAYRQALKKVCTTLTSGWFRDHAIDNFPSIVRLYDKDKFNLVKEDLK